jgi:hypothetical protein
MMNRRFEWMLWLLPKRLREWILDLFPALRCYPDSRYKRFPYLLYTEVYSKECIIEEVNFLGWQADYDFNEGFEGIAWSKLNYYDDDICFLANIGYFDEVNQ